MNLIDLIRAAIKEDMPSGDLTTESLGLSPRPGVARLIAKQELVLSGTGVFEQTLLTLEPNARVTWHHDEGAKVTSQQTVATIHGDLVQLLKAERVALNFIMHLSGIATLTNKFVARTAGTKTRILDTRKTLPGYRDLEKRAVAHGGGLNHRMNLSTAVLIKDNHIALCGGIAKAVARVRQHIKLPIEVEAESFADVEECLKYKVERILLDNMDDELIAKVMQIIPASVETEASGNMHLERIAKVASLGVDFISVGALTHSAPSADLSLDFDWMNS
jgi:nicotinate-nucleotide pyrophosphorylase (carboxylating)